MAAAFTQDKIDAAFDNEVRELAEKLWYLRQDFSDRAKEFHLLSTISSHFMQKGFPEDTKEIARLLRIPAYWSDIKRQMDVFVDVYESEPDLLRFRQIHDPQKLANDLHLLFTFREQFQGAVF